jgi:predicted Rossmann-fold nucleotide-binding protein
MTSGEMRGIVKIDTRKLVTMNESFEAATLVPCGKTGPFPVILMGSEFWQGLRDWGTQAKKLGVFPAGEVEFGYVTDSPREAVDFILASLPAHLRPGRFIPNKPSS